ncbi:hypothetical protein [Propionibacterium sp.]|uniref:hypothetical protein n=1 Tax=Propionibacterium sp. TaxID=1977903 RepID=UPI00345E1FDA
MADQDCPDVVRNIGVQSLLGKLQRGARRFGGGEHVKHDPPGLRLHQRQIGDIESAHLVDRVGNHLEQSGQSIRLRMYPQARIHRRGNLRIFQEIELAHIPHLSPLVVQDLQRVSRTYQVCAGHLIFGVRGVVQVDSQPLGHARIELARETGGRLRGVVQPTIGAAHHGLGI